MRFACFFFFIHFFFFNDTATTEIYTLSLHDALPICTRVVIFSTVNAARDARRVAGHAASSGSRSEEHTSELHSLAYLVCRLLLEKKKKTIIIYYTCRSNTSCSYHCFCLLSVLCYCSL